MNQQIDPSRTYAVVVSVEQYADSAWNVAGPYADACAFVRWLTERCSVPAGNVRVLAAQLPGSSGVMPRGVVTAEPNAGTVSELFLEGLADLDADLLWVFWSGHGVLDSSAGHVVLLSDSTVRTKKAVQVSALHRALQSARIGQNDGQGVRKAVLAVNACQNQPRLESLTEVPVVPHQLQAVNRGLFALTACGTAQRARIAPAGGQADGLAASIFPRALLAALDDGSLRVLPDMHEVADSVDEQLADWRTAKATGQQLSLQRLNWEGRTRVTGSFVLEPTGDEQRLAAAVEVLLPTPEGRTDAARALSAHVPVLVPLADQAEAPSTQDLVTAAARTAHGLPTLLHQLATGPHAPQDPNALDRARAAAKRVRPDEFLTADEFTTLTGLFGRCGVPDLRAAIRPDRVLRPHAPDEEDDESLICAVEAAGLPHGAVPPPLLHLVAVVAAEADATKTSAPDTDGDMAHRGEDVTGKTPAPVPHSAQKHPEPEEAGPSGGSGGPASDASGLYAWATAVAKRLGIPQQTVDAQFTKAVQDVERRRSHRAWLQIRIDAENPDQEPGSGSYACRAWLADPASGPQPVPLPRSFAPWSRLRLHIGEAIEPHLVDADRPLGVEFFLPPGQLELQVERIPVRHRDMDGVLLGSQAWVVVRLARRQTPWSQRWDVMGADLSPGEQHWLRRPADNVTALSRALEAAPSAGCVHLHGDAPEFSEALARCAFHGVPVITWHRKLAGRRPDPDIHDICCQVHPYQLPDDIRQLRDNQDTAGWPGCDHLVLLWDDPRRLPPRFRPRTPGRNGGT
ncbi:hypothetical protein ACFVW1_37245 [Streptomyces olivochromogenes]|uniref:VMAP-C domain-containing protein n=1 Tax=Streptomyces olivochromogenes TaxID=1963 RepID=UPI0036DDF24A